MDNVDEISKLLVVNRALKNFLVDVIEEIFCDGSFVELTIDEIFVTCVNGEILKNFYSCCRR